MQKYRVLVFPCGSECGLEIGRSLSNLKEVDLWGASSVDDHGKFFYGKYVGDLPFITDRRFLDEINKIIQRNRIDFVYPAMDSVVAELAKKQNQLYADIVGSPSATAEIALSKKRTYETLRQVVRCPEVYETEQLVKETFPVFLKPEIGHGSRGVLLASTRDEVVEARRHDPSLMILENLPGEEYTVDCFTNFNGDLKFVGARIRKRVFRGISVNTRNVHDREGRFASIAEAINRSMVFNGAWFYQVKKASDGELTLLEVAPRVAGSMALHRYKGVNLPFMSILNQSGVPVEPLENPYNVEMDRALSNRTSISFEYRVLYLDLDDCLFVENLYLNPDVVKLVIECRNAGKSVVLITRHDGNAEKRLEDFGIRGLFHAIHHLKNGEYKTDYMEDKRGVLVDDSFSERLEAARAGIPSLGPESVEALFEGRT